MRFALDHIFIMTAVGAPEGNRLVDFGLTEGTSNRHTGQGTENRRFFFEQGMLELLWVYDQANAQNLAIEKTNLWDRWTFRGGAASPFGICVKPVDTTAGQAPFPAFKYTPPYLPEGLFFWVADTAVSEPLWFCPPSERLPNTGRVNAEQPTEHDAGFKAITAVTVTIPGAGGLSDVAKIIDRESPVTVQSGDEHLFTVRFDDAQVGKTHDFRPGLPLIFRW